MSSEYRTTLVSTEVIVNCPKNIQRLIITGGAVKLNLLKAKDLEYVAITRGNYRKKLIIVPPKNNKNLHVCCNASISMCSDVRSFSELNGYKFSQSSYGSTKMEEILLSRDL